MSDAAILLVDDNPGKRLSIRAILEPLGHTVIEAESGEQALHAAMVQRFAVILMDVQMPEMDGYETASFLRLRQDCEHTPIIFITAHSRDEAELPIAYQSGAVDFMFGTPVPEIMRAKVAVFVELYLKSRELEQSLSDVVSLSHLFRDNEIRTRSVLEHVADGIVTVDDDGVIESFNRAASALFGYDESDAIGQSFNGMVKRVDGHASDGDGGAVGLRRDGSSFPIEIDFSDVELGSRGIHIACVRDISARLSYTQTLQHTALHDSLTSLPNRVLFANRVDHALQAATRSGHSLALLVMDLNGFKQVNDRLGHQHGDELLEQVAQRLGACLREGDTVARLGGDEFGILPVGDTDLAGAVAVAWKVQDCFSRPFDVGGHALDIGASIGISLAPEHGDTMDALLRRADLAMYDAKRSGSGYALFAAEQEDAPARRLELIEDLRRCVARDELVLHYQPKIDLVTQQTIGVEALIRWNHPSGRLMMPVEFMPEVECSELMLPFTEWVINEALGQLRAWRDEGYDLTMAVNLGALCLVEGSGLFETVDALTESWGVPAEKLTFELTESALIDTAVPGLLERLASMDERLSIDDFGTGYSSLVYLQRLPVVEIKADRSFVSTLASVKEDAVIVRSIIDLAHNLSLRVVAEGVEDEATLKLLMDFGCDEGQGYYFSRPLPAAELARWLTESRFGASPLLAGASTMRVDVVEHALASGA